MCKKPGIGVLAALMPLALSLASASGAVEEFAYVGTKRCKMCHLKQWRSWAETSMASAYDTLKPGMAVEAKESAGLDPALDYTRADGCVVCHVTGFGKEGGFVDMEKTPDLAGVGCESCHGPGGTYTQSQYMSLRNKEFTRSDVVAVGLVETVGEAQCVVCHNSASPFVSDSDVFSYEQAKERDTHRHYALEYEH
jgi:hypothetical protein